MGTLSKDGPIRFRDNWSFMLAHMPAVRGTLSAMPSGYFLDFATADAQRDMKEATDLVLEVSGGTMAVRVRRRSYYLRTIRMGFGFDWSVRCKSRSPRTEIHKLRDGFGDWYFYGYSADDIGKLAAWWLIDLYRVREEKILDEGNDWKVYDNEDGTAGMYIPLRILEERGCVIDRDNSCLEDS